MTVPTKNAKRTELSQAVTQAVRDLADYEASEATHAMVHAAAAEVEKRRTSAFDLIAATEWAIQPQMLETIASIARRENESPEAVAAKLGRPLQNTRSVTVRDGVAVVPVTGPIMRYANLFSDISGATSLDVLSRDFTAALNDSAVKAIVLEMDSPGGQATGIAEFAQMVRSAEKPVVAYVDGSASSAAYWIAAAADQVVVSKTGSVGSIGAVVAIDTRPQLGMMEIVSSQSPKKRVDPSTDEGRAQIQARIDALAQVFIEDVAVYRGVSVETVLAQFGQGDTRMGVEAVKLGMADGVSTLEQVIAGLAGTTKGASQTMAIATKGVPAAIENAAEGDVCQLEDGTEGIIKDGACVPKEPAAEPSTPAALAAKYRAEGVSVERARVQALLSTPLASTYGDLLTKAIASGQNQGEFALAILAAEGKGRSDKLAVLRTGQQALPQPALPNDGLPAAASELPLEERCKAQWDANPKLRAEFGDNFNGYLAYERAASEGKVKVLKAKA